MLNCGMNVKPLDDTSPIISGLLIEGYRKMTATEKIDRVRGLTLAVQQLALADIRRRHPEANAREQALRLASRWIDPELMKQVFGWDIRTAGY
jgi:hypothetical protein